MKLSGVGTKSSKQRNAVIETFEAAKKHLTIDELFEDVKSRHPNIGYTTVWRTLKLLEACGQAIARKFHDGFTRYEFSGAKVHHDHLICFKCGHVEEFTNPKIEEIQKKIARSHNFKMTAHKMELYGYCKKCGK